MKKYAAAFLSLLIIICNSCSKSSGGGGTTPPTVALPAATISDVSNDRTSSNIKYQFSVSLDKVSTSAISIGYTTADGSAVSNKDYKPVSGTLTIPANSSSGTIEVEVIADSLRKTNQTFTVQLSSPSGCTLSTNKGTGTIVNENLLYYPVDNAGYSTPLIYPGKTLTWSEEFDGSTINQNVWTFETGGGGWGNAELENYSAKTQNAFQSKGNLIIEARRENGNSYSSARMITKNKKVFNSSNTSRIDIRAKIPVGKGIWPAIWMLGNNIDQVSWPACGEIDIMEILGNEPNKLYGTFHFGANSTLHVSKGTSYVLSSGSFDQQFHVYSLVWMKDQAQILIDDIPYFTLTTAMTAGNAYPFNSDFFFILNVAVGGNWPGSPDATTVFPQRLVVDYIRVFQ